MDNLEDQDRVTIIATGFVHEYGYLSPEDMTEVTALVLISRPDLDRSVFMDAAVGSYFLRRGSHDLPVLRSSAV